MAMALVRAAMFLVRAFSAILRANSLFVAANSMLRAKTVLKLKDIYEIAKKTKDVRDFIKKTLFNKVLQTHRFIFFNENELREYILSIDPNARILKLLDLYECSLYIVEFSDIQLFLNEEKENIFLKFIELGFLNQMFIYMSYFLSDTLKEIENKVKELREELKKDYNELINNINNNIDDIINKYKSMDIANTYCLRCSCCCGCSCEKGSCSCCCGCECNLVHYVESWEKAREDLKNKLKEELYSILLDKNNKNSYYNYINYVLYDKNNKESFRNAFLAFLGSLLSSLRNKTKAKLLFCVLKSKNIEYIAKREEHSTKVMRTTYKYLNKIRGKRFEYNNFIKKLKNYLYWELKKEYTRKQVITIYNEVIRRYNLRKIKFKKNNKTYIVIY